MLLGQEKLKDRKITDGLTLQASLRLVEVTMNRRWPHGKCLRKMKN